jgi:methionyl-tRNA formyltransferase
MVELARRRGLVIAAPENINDPAALEMIVAQRPELLVVCDYGQILAPEVLAAAPLGGINLHASLLPKYRGAAPVTWALYPGERATGVTVIHMTPKLDAGPCLVQRTLSIEAHEDAVALENRLARLGVEAVGAAITLLEAWDQVSILGTLQDSSQATRAPRLKKEDGLVDWSRPAHALVNQVRAFQPWPGTYAHWRPSADRSLRLILVEVAAAPAGDETAKSGTVLEASEGRLAVATGRGRLEIRRLKPSGGQVLSSEEFLRGYRVRVGDRLE